MINTKSSKSTISQHASPHPPAPPCALTTPSDGPRIDRIDPLHPALRGFKLLYRWESVQEEDMDLAKGLLLTMTFGALLVICFQVYSHVEREMKDEAAVSSGGSSGKGKGKGQQR